MSRWREDAPAHTNAMNKETNHRHYCLYISDTAPAIHHWQIPLNGLWASSGKMMHANECGPWISSETKRSASDTCIVHYYIDVSRDEKIWSKRNRKRLFQQNSIPKMMIHDRGRCFHFFVVVTSSLQRSISCVQWKRWCDRFIEYFERQSIQW